MFFIDFSSKLSLITPPKNGLSPSMSTWDAQLSSAKLWLATLFKSTTSGMLIEVVSICFFSSRSDYSFNKFDERLSKDGSSSYVIWVDLDLWTVRPKSSRLSLLNDWACYSSLQSSKISSIILSVPSMNGSSKEIFSPKPSNRLTFYWSWLSLSNLSSTSSNFTSSSSKSSTYGSTLLYFFLSSDRDL